MKLKSRIFNRSTTDGYLNVMNKFIEENNISREQIQCISEDVYCINLWYWE